LSFRIDGALFYQLRRNFTEGGCLGIAAPADTRKSTEFGLFTLALGRPIVPWGLRPCDQDGRRMTIGHRGFKLADLPS